MHTGPLLTTAEAAATARRKPVTIRLWVHRGYLTPRDRDRRGWPLYAAGDVLAAEKRARQRDDTTRSVDALRRA